MAEKKTWSEVHVDEVLSDNSQVENCNQCKDCIFRSDGTTWANDYRKSSCMIYKYPNMKPLRVINNEGLCEYHNNGDEEPQE